MSPTEHFRALLENKLRRRLTNDQVNEIVEQNWLPETPACVAPKLNKQIQNYVPSDRRKAVENQEMDLILSSERLNVASQPRLHDRLEVSNDQLLNTLQLTLCMCTRLCKRHHYYHATF